MFLFVFLIIVFVYAQITMDDVSQ